MNLKWKWLNKINRDKLSENLQEKWNHYAKGQRSARRKMIVAWLSRTIAVPEPALRLLISVLIGKFWFQFTFNSGSSLSKEEKISYRFSFYWFFSIFLRFFSFQPTPSWFVIAVSSTITTASQKSIPIYYSPYAELWFACLIMASRSIIVCSLWHLPTQSLI